MRKSSGPRFTARKRAVPALVVGLCGAVLWTGCEDGDGEAGAFDDVDAAAASVDAAPASVDATEDPSRAGTGSAARDPAPGARIEPGHRIRGISLSAPRREMADDALEPAASAGANWVAVVPYAFVDPDNPVVTYDRERQFWGETSGGVARSIEHARASGLSVLVKPHLWVAGQGWAGDFEPRTDEEWDTFLSGYRDYILRFAEVADSMDAGMFSVGTEVDRIALARPDYWRGLIAEVRQIYGGRLTYAANWDAYADIEFWDALDLVGVDAYFPLVGDATPDVEALVAAWTPWRAELHQVAARTGKPILFAEFGYRSMDGAAGEQWELPDGRAARGHPANYEAQAVAYEALFRVWWDCSWFAGGFAWKWYPGSPAGDWIATDYSPQGKPAETVLASWYGGDAQALERPRLLRTGGPGAG